MRKAFFCDLAGARTQDPLLKREMLYQLSYQVMMLTESFAVCGCKYTPYNLFHKSNSLEIYFFLKSIKICPILHKITA